MGTILANKHWGLIGLSLFLLFNQILHMNTYMNDPLMATAWMLVIYLGWPVIIALALNGKTMIKVIALASAIPLFIFGDLLSIEASKLSFAQKKHQQIMDQKMGTQGRVLNNQMAVANNRLVELSNQGVHSGPEYDAAQQQVQSALAQQQQFSSSEGGTESAAERALMASNKGGDLDQVIEKKNTMRSWGLEVLFVLTGIWAGMWTAMKIGVDIDYRGLMNTPKSPPKRPTKSDGGGMYMNMPKKPQAPAEPVREQKKSPVADLDKARDDDMVLKGLEGLGFKKGESKNLLKYAGEGSVENKIKSILKAQGSNQGK